MRREGKEVVTTKGRMAYEADPSDDVDAFDEEEGEDSPDELDEGVENAILFEVTKSMRDERGETERETYSNALARDRDQVRTLFE
jgi:hypothetical protein